MSNIVFKPFRLALIQMKVVSSKAQNLESARAKVLKASQEGKANVVVLPECFNSSYGTQFFAQFAENIPGGESTKALSALAQEAKVYLIGGSIPERDPDSGKLFNTCTVYNPKGDLIAKHRKLHLFDIDVPGKIRFQESEVLSPGEELTHFDTEYGKLGVGICYDIRFPEVARIASKLGCVAMIYPGAFNVTTGPLHWELLQRARAVDNQFYVATCSPARDLEGTYPVWGHSTIVDPKGQVVATTEEKEDIIYADLDPEELFSFRQNIPISTQARPDIYQKYENKSTTL